MAKIYAPAEACEAGYLDQAVAADALAETATAAAKALSGLSLKAFAITKKRMREGAIERINAGFEADLDVLTSLAPGG